MFDVAAHRRHRRRQLARNRGPVRRIEIGTPSIDRPVIGGNVFRHVARRGHRIFAQGAFAARLVALKCGRGRRMLRFGRDRNE
jgi:hypothetical protein